MFDPDEVITKYSIKEAIAMGVFRDRWSELSGGKPIVASANLFEFEGEKGLWRSGKGLCFGRNMCCRLDPETVAFFNGVALAYDLGI